MSDSPQVGSGVERAIAARLLMAAVDDDYATADRVLAEEDAVLLMKGLLAWAMALGDRVAAGDRDRLRRFFADQMADVDGGVRR